MFNLTGSEIVFLLVAGLVVLGPERLPGVIRRAARTYAEIRRTVREYERDFRETFKEPLDEVRGVVTEFKQTLNGVDREPSPPMRPEQAVAIRPEDGGDKSEGSTSND